MRSHGTVVAEPSDLGVGEVAAVLQVPEIPPAATGPAAHPAATATSNVWQRVTIFR